MPEDIGSLLADFGVDPNTGTPDAGQQQQQTSNATPPADNNGAQAPSTGTQNPDAGTQNPTAPEGDGNGDNGTQTADQNAAADAQAQMQAQLEQQRANQAFAQMRAENNKYKKFMQTLMRGSNFNGDEETFIQALENEAYKKQAQLQGMAANPELLRKMDQQEEQIKELTKSQRDQTLMLGLKTLQQTNNLSGKEVEAFVQKAIENRIDLLAPGVNFDTLYKGMFFDDIITKRIEDERQKWIAQSNKANSAATPDNKSGKKDPAPTDVKTMAEFNSLLQTVSKEIK